MMVQKEFRAFVVEEQEGIFTRKLKYY